MPYREEVEQRYNEVFENEYTILLNGRTSNSAMESAEKGSTA